MNAQFQIEAGRRFQYLWGPRPGNEMMMPRPGGCGGGGSVGWELGEVGMPEGCHAPAPAVSSRRDAADRSISRTHLSRAHTQHPHTHSLQWQSQRICAVNITASLFCARIDSFTKAPFFLARELFNASVQECFNDGLFYMFS